MSIAIDDIVLFVCVAESGSLSAAARELGVSPSAVSRQVKRIEDRLGVRLLERSTRKLRLTSEGDLYLARGRDILQALRDAEREITGQDGVVSGPLRISSSVPFGQRVLVPQVSAFLAQHPRVDLELRMNDQVVDLFDEQVDVAIRVGNLPDSSMRVRKLGTVTRHLVASPDYLAKHGTPTTPDELADHQCITFTVTAGLNRWPFESDTVVPVTGRVRTNNGETVRLLALAGAGIARLGDFLIEEDLASGRLVTVLADAHLGSEDPIHAIYLAQGPVPARVRAFVDFLAESHPPTSARDN